MYLCCQFKRAMLFHFQVSVMIMIYLAQTEGEFFILEYKNVFTFTSIEILHRIVELMK